MIDNETNLNRAYNAHLSACEEAGAYCASLESEACDLWEKRDMRTQVNGYTLADIFEAECEDFADFAVQMSLRPDEYAKELIRYWAWKQEE